MNKQTKWVVTLAVSMFVFGTIGLFVKNINLPSAETALYRALLAILLIGIFLLATRQRISISKIKHSLPWLIASGVAMGINWILLFEAYRYTTVSMATLSYYFAPVIVTVASPLLFKEKTEPKHWICFGASTVGIVLITGLGTVGQGNHLTGIILGLGAAAFYATVILLNKHIKGVDGIQRTFLQFIAAAATLLPYTAHSTGINIGSLDATSWINLLIVGLFHTGFTYCLYFSALKELPGHKTAILSYIDPLVAVLASVIVLGEEMLPWQIVGGVLILGSTLFNELYSRKGK